MGVKAALILSLRAFPLKIRVAVLVVAIRMIPPL
jgi:hypothetical protein